MIHLLSRPARSAAAALSIVLLATISGCGIRGPLVLPEPEKATVPAKAGDSQPPKAPNPQSPSPAN